MRCEAARIHRDAANGLNAKINKAALDSNLEASSNFSGLRSFTVIDNSWNWGWGGPTPAPNIHGAPKTERERDEEKARIAAFIGSVVAGVFAFITAITYKSYSADKKVFTETGRIRQHALDHFWDVSVDNISEKNLRRSFFNLMKAQLEIDILKYQKSSDRFYTSLAMLVGGATLASGGILMVPFLMTAGKVVLLVSTLVGLFGLGSHWNDSDAIIAKQREIVGTRDQLGLADEVLARVYASRNLSQGGATGVDHTPSAPPQIDADYQSITPDNFDMNRANTALLANNEAAPRQLRK